MSLKFKPSRFSQVGIAIFVIASLTGCGDGNPPTYSVTGTVKFADGKPLTTGTIEFEAQDHELAITATGEIDSEGRFSLGTFDINDGAIEGRHRVAIISDFQIGNEAERPGLIPKSELDPKYRTFENSGLEKIVTDGTNEFEFVVDHK